MGHRGRIRPRMGRRSGKALTGLRGSQLEHHRASGLGGARRAGRTSRPWAVTSALSHAEAPLQGGANAAWPAMGVDGRTAGGVPGGEGRRRAGLGGQAAETRVSASAGSASEVGRVTAHQEPVDPRYGTPTRSAAFMRAKSRVGRVAARQEPVGCVRRGKSRWAAKGTSTEAVSSAPGRARAACERGAATSEPGAPRRQDHPGAPRVGIKPRGGNAYPGMRVTSARQRETSTRTTKVGSAR